MMPSETCPECWKRSISLVEVPDADLATELAHSITLDATGLTVVDEAHPPRVAPAA
jgi:hypothetical protein